MTKYKRYAPVDGKKPIWVIVENGKIINYSPSKEELKGLDRDTHTRKKYTDEKLLEHLRRFEIEKGRSPKEEDFSNNPKYPNHGTYMKRFGNWNNSLKLAGLQVNNFTDTTDNELLEFIIRFEREKGRSPKTEDFNDNPKYPNFNTYVRRFGSWNKSLQMAKLEVNRFVGLTNEELLEFIRIFEREEGRPPTADDFKNSPKYPNYGTYIRHFGGWQKALKLVGLDTSSMVRKGIIETNNQKARLAEIFVLDHFAEKVTDLSGENWKSFADGICPNNQIYDVKSSALLESSGRDYHWYFTLTNLRSNEIRRDEIEWFYLLGFDEDYSDLRHSWRIPGDFTDGNFMRIGINSNFIYNVENMKEYEITEKFKGIDFLFLNE